MRMKVALLDTYDVWTHSSLALRYLEGYALADQDLARTLEISVHSLPVESLRDDPISADRDSGCLSRLLAFDPDVVGLSCYMWNLPELLRLAATLKKRRPGLAVIAGGPEVSSPSMARRILREAPHVSFVAIGEGEILFRRLMRYLAGGNGQVDGMPGLAFRRPAGAICLGPPAEAINNLDEIPSPLLGRRFSPGAFEYVLMETYRGCENQCQWCAWSRGRHREFSLDRVLAELRLLISAGAPHVYVVDGVLGPGRARSEPILDLLIRAKEEGDSVPGFFVYPNTTDFDEVMARKFRDANCRVAFGLQSTNPDALARAHRRQELGRFEVALRNANACFPGYEVDLIYGLPGDTYDGFIRSFNWLADRRPPRIYSHRLRGLPGTPFYENAAEHGIVFEDSTPHLLVSTVTLPERDRRRLDQFSMGVYCFYNWATVTFRYLVSTLKAEPASVVADFVGWAEQNELVSSEGPLPNYFSASADYSLALVEAFLRNMVDRSDAMAERVERFKAALRFDRACCECHRDFRFRNPGRRSRPGPVPRWDWETMMLQPAEPPMRVVRIPEDVAVAAGLTSNPPCGQALPDPGGCERTYLIHRRGFARVGHVAGRVLEIAARQESRTLGEIAATLKLSSPDLGQATGELQALAREGVIDLI